MSAQYLTAVEHELLPVDERVTSKSLTAAEAEYLSVLGEERPGFCDRGFRTVRLAQYCGIVSLGSRVLEILPKVDEAAKPEQCRGALLRLLRNSEGLPLFRHLAVGHHLRHAPLLEVFIAAFFDAVLEIVRGGLMRRYEEHEDDLYCMRGGVLISKQLTVLANRPDLIACRFDELTPDNQWNRLIKAALRVVRPWIVSVDLYRRWIELTAVFEDVTDVEPGRLLLDRLVFDRHGARYRNAMEWVSRIFQFLSPSLRAGGNEAPALLFDMNQLFESALATQVQRQFCGKHGGPRVFLQEGSLHLASVAGTKYRTSRLRPDLLVRQGDQVIAIGDTKWKRVELGKGGYVKAGSDDIYQMHAYAAAFRCERLVLIFPWHSGLANAKATKFELPSVDDLQPTISIVFVDVHTDPFDVLDCADALGLSNFPSRMSHDVAVPKNAVVAL